MLAAVRDGIIFLYDAKASLSDNLIVKRSPKLEIEEIVFLTGVNILCTLFLFTARYAINAGYFGWCAVQMIRKITAFYNAYQAERVYNNSGSLGNLRDVILFMHDIYFTGFRIHNVEESVPEEDYLFLTSVGTVAVSSLGYVVKEVIFA